MRAGFLGALLLLAGGYSYVAFADLSYLSSAGRLGPGFFPRIIGVSLTALCAYSLYADRARTPEPLSAAEIERSAEAQFSPLALDRSWEYFCQRAGVDPG